MSRKMLVKAIVIAMRNRGVRVSEKLTRKFLYAFSDVLVSELQQGNDVSVAGLAKFHIKVLDARIGRNPKNGQEIAIPARKVLRAKPLKKLTDAVV